MTNDRTSNTSTEEAEKKNADSLHGKEGKGPGTKPKPIRASKEEALTKQYVNRLYSDPVFFVREVWAARDLDEVAPLGPVELDIIRWTFHGPFTKRGERKVYPKRGALAFRGSGKTTLVSICYSLWLLFRDPNHKVMLISKSEEEAKKTIHVMRRWIRTIPFVHHLTPNISKGQRSSTLHFDVGPAAPDRVPSVRAAGIGGQIEGSRAHTIIPDDVEIDTNTRTIVARNLLNERVKEFNAILYPGGEVVYLGTFHHEDSLYIKLGRRGYMFRSWPIACPKQDDKLLGLAPRIKKAIEEGRLKPGDPTCPKRFGPKAMESRRKEGATYFAMQFMLIMDLGDDLQYPLKLKDFIVMDRVDRDRAPISIMWGTRNGAGDSTIIDDIPVVGFEGDYFLRPVLFSAGEVVPYTGTKMWIDPSGRGADHTAWAIIGHAGGTLWVKRIGSTPGGYENETLHTIADEARKYGVNEIFVEDNFGQGMFSALLRPILARYFLDAGEDPVYPKGWKASIENVRVAVQKEVRIIDALEGVMNSHRVVISREIAENEEWQYQVTRINRNPNCLTRDDELEVLAMCVQMWKDVLEQDPREAAKKYEDEKIDEAIEEHRRIYELMGGTTSQEPRWFQHH